jgi:capsule polysaccharide export protein KpsE/RkpR
VSLPGRTALTPIPASRADSVAGAMPPGGWVESLSQTARELIGRSSGLFSFWTVVPVVGLIGFVYLYAFSDSMYVSQTIFNLQNASSTSTSLSSMVGSSLLGTSGSANEAGAVMAYIESPEMLAKLDKQFHLRALYSSSAHSPFWRLAPDASNEDFLTFYQQMVLVSQDSTTQLITLQVMDYNAKRAQAISYAILAASRQFVNALTKTMQDATIKYAKDQLTAAEKAVETAQPYDRTVAEDELTAAQQAMAASQGIASQQVVFLIPISNPTLPTDASIPDRLADEAGILLCAAALYLIGHLLLANVRDHRKV